MVCSLNMLTSMDSVKNPGRGKFFSCFTTLSDEGDDPGFLSASTRYSDKETRRRRKMAAPIMFSASLKAVCFRSPLMKKLRNKSCRTDSYRSSSKLSTKSDEPSKSIGGTFPDKEEDNFLDHSSSMRSTSSNSSSFSNCSKSGSERSQEPERSSPTNVTRLPVNEDASACNYKPAKTMCILVACLVALVFSGKAFAVVTCTSALLFWALGGRWWNKVLPVGNDVDSEEYKKRVILEGLLERNRPAPRVILPIKKSHLTINLLEKKC